MRLGTFWRAGMPSSLSSARNWSSWLGSAAAAPPRRLAAPVSTTMGVTREPVWVVMPGNMAGVSVLVGPPDGFWIVIYATRSLSDQSSPGALGINCAFPVNSPNNECSSVSIPYPRRSVGQRHKCERTSRGSGNQSPGRKKQEPMTASDIIRVVQATLIGVGVAFAISVVVAGHD
jgi:hypothetical protein